MQDTYLPPSPTTPLSSSFRARNLYFRLTTTFIFIFAVIAVIQFFLQQEQLERQRLHQKACVYNLKAIKAATEQWAMDHKKGPDTAAPSITDLVGPYLKYMPQCASGGSYLQGPTVLKSPKCTFQALPEFRHAISCACDGMDEW